MKSQPNKTLDKANAQTDKGHDHEHQQQGLTRDAGTERRHPRNSFGNEGSNVRQNGSYSHKLPPLQANQAPNQTNAQTHERHNDEHENQGIGSDSADERANPLDRLSDQRRNIGQNSSNSNGSFSLKTYHLSHKNTNPLLSNARYIPEHANDNNEKTKADKVAKRLRHQERWKMLQKPKNKGLHISHGANPLPA